MPNSYAMRPTVAGEAPTAVQRVSGRKSYAAPGDFDAATPEYEQDGFSPSLGPGSEGFLPDEIRTGKREPVYGGPHQQDINVDRGTDDLRRRDDEYQQSTGWHTKQSKPEIAPIPEQVQDIGPSRPTANMGQNSYLFMRPWERPESSGQHLSMADHRRNYPIYGMRPQGDVGVNTYRLDPKPWDASLHYNPPRQPESAGPLAAALAIGGNRSYRA